MSKIISLLIAGISTSVIASTIVEPINIDFNENSKINISLSVRDFNKLKVKDEVITDLYYVQDAFNISYKVPSFNIKERGEGAIYVTPLTEKPSVIYITTDKGHHFSVESVLSDNSGNTYIFNYQKQLKRKVAHRSKAKPSYQEMLVNNLATGQVPKGFSQKKFKQERFSLSKNLKVAEVREYQGNGYLAKIYRVSNYSRDNLKVDIKRFIHKGVMAAAQDSNILPSKQSMNVYTIERG